MCDFLELDYPPDMLAIEQTDRSKVVEDQSAWFTNVWAGITTAAVGKWRTELTPRQVESSRPSPATSSARSATRRAAATASPALVPAYATHDAAMRGVNFVRLRLVQERGREVRHVLRRKLAR